MQLVRRSCQAAAAQWIRRCMLQSIHRFCIEAIGHRAWTDHSYPPSKCRLQRCLYCPCRIPPAQRSASRAACGQFQRTNCCSPSGCYSAGTISWPSGQKITSSLRALHLPGLTQSQLLMLRSQQLHLWRRYELHPEEVRLLDFYGGAQVVPVSEYYSVPL